MQADMQDDTKGVIDPAWLREQVDLLALEEGLTGHPLDGPYLCANGPRERSAR